MRRKYLLYGIALLLMTLILGGCFGRSNKTQTVVEATIVGTIQEAKTLNPLGGAIVAVREKRATTDGAGAYRITGVPVGPAVLTASESNHETVSQSINVVAGTNQISTIALRKFADGILKLDGFGVSSLLSLVSFANNTTAGVYSFTLNTSTDGIYAKPALKPAMLASSPATAPPQLTISNHFREREREFLARSPRFSRFEKMQRPFALLTVGDQKSFYVEEPKNGYGYNWVNATLKVAGNNVYLYIDNTASVNFTTLLDLKTAFDTKLYPNLTSTFGDIIKPGDPSGLDIDGEGPIFVLLTPMTPGLLGYYFVINQFPQSLASRYGYVSNEKDIVFLNSDYAGNTNIYATLAHEFMHLVHQHQRLKNNAGAETLWVSEGLAMLAQDVAGYGGEGLQYAVPFLQHPSSYSLIEENSYSFNSASYGEAYLFFRYLEDQIPGTGRKIVQSTSKGIPAVETAASARFNDLVKDWAMAVYLDSSPYATNRYSFPSINVPKPSAQQVGVNTSIWQYFLAYAPAYFEIQGSAFEQLPGKLFVQVKPETGTTLDFAYQMIAK